jgi:hypothetical protein
MSANHTAAADPNRVVLDPGTVLPDRAVCGQRLPTGVPNLSHCVVDRPAGCPYAISYGLGHLCSWPDDEPTEDSAGVVQ